MVDLLHRVHVGRCVGAARWRRQRRPLLRPVARYLDGFGAPNAGQNFVGLPSGPARAAPVYLVQVEVGDDQRLPERRATGHRPAVRAAYDTVAVEHQLVLSADSVEIGDEQPVIRGTGSDHPPAGLALPGVEGRRVDVHDQLRAVLPLDRRGPRIVPDVLAHVHADSRAVELINRADGPRCKVAFLVENTIVGQIDFVVGVHPHAVTGNGGGVGGPLSLVHVTHHYGGPVGALRQPAGGRHVLFHEGFLQKKVLRRVAGDRHLRKGHQVGSQPAGLVQVLLNFLAVAPNVPHRGVNLGQGEAEYSWHDWQYRRIEGGQVESEYTESVPAAPSGPFNSNVKLVRPFR